MLAFGLMASFIWPTQCGAQETLSSIDKQSKTIVDTEVITLSADGATPERLSRGPKPFFLYLRSRQEDGTTLSDLSLVPAVPLLDVRVLAGILNATEWARRQRSAGLVTLPPGEYYLQSSKSHKTICTIIIRAAL